ncbi:DinB family protein [Dehalobacter restrictus]|uniref:DinB family protein n=1 Tax=Dehalobacter restrictus TaxID=55583 RepID=UPI00338DDFA9
MNIETKQLTEDWGFIRGNTTAFIEGLSDEQLMKAFPRPGLDSFLKQFQEMVDVQEAYLDACESGKMAFGKIKENDEYGNDVTREAILAKMKEQDSRVETLLAAKSDAEIVWDENDKKTISAQIRNLCMHEALHVGQLIAFSYALGISIPESVVEAWALS